MSLGLVRGNWTRVPGIWLDTSFGTKWPKCKVPSCTRVMNFFKISFYCIHIWFWSNFLQRKTVLKYIVSNHFLPHFVVLKGIASNPFSTAFISIRHLLKLLISCTFSQMLNKLFCISRTLFFILQFSIIEICYFLW